MKIKILLLASLIVSVSTVCLDAQTTTAFSFQGQLSSNGVAANGLYDLQFTLYDNATNGNLIAGPVTNLDTTVSSGLFSAQVNFGAGAFSGPARWLQVGVRSSTNALTNAFAELTPRQLITAAPYSISAINVVGPLAPTNLTGLGVVTNGSTNLTLNGVFTGLYIGSGAGLTNINAANLVGSVNPLTLASVPAAHLTGLVQPANLPTNLLTFGQTGVTLNGSFSGSFSGSGNGLTNIPTSGLSGFISSSQLPPGLLTNGAIGVTMTGTFTGNHNGNGLGLTNLNATNLIGTLQPTNFPVGLLLNSATNASLSGAFSGTHTGTFSGSGAGLTNLAAANLTGAIGAANLPASALTNTETGVTLAGTFSGNGSGLTNLPVNVPAGLITNNQTGVTLAGSFSGSHAGNGAGLTNLAAANLTGTVAAANLPAAVLTNSQTGVTLSGTLSGNGAGLTNLNATNLVGTIGSSSLPAAVVLNSGTNVTLSGTFNGNGAGLTNLTASSLTGTVASGNLPGAVLTNNETGVTLSGSFSGSHAGNGAGLTNLAAANLTGTVAAANLPAAVLTNSQTGVTLSGTLSGNGAGLTNLAAANLTGPISAANLPPSALTNTETGVTLGGTFSGNGAGLTSLNASALSSGTVALAQLPGSVLTQGQSFVQLSGNFSGFFNGNGSGLNSLSAGTLTGSVPVSALTVVPAGNLTGTVPSGALSGTYTNQVVFTAPAYFNNPNSVFAGTVLNAQPSQTIGNLEVTTSAVFTNNVTVSITNINGAGIILSPSGITNSGVQRIGGWLVGPTTNAGGFWITNGTLFVTNVPLASGVVVGGNSGNIALSGTISGNGTGLTNAAGNGYVDSTITNVLSAATGSAHGAITNYVVASSNALWTDLQNTNTIQVATNGVLQTQITGHGILITSTSNGLWADLQNTNTIQVATNGVLQTQITGNGILITTTSNGLWADIQNTNTIQVATNGVLQTQISGNGALIATTSNGLWTDIQATNTALQADINAVSNNFIASVGGQGSGNIFNAPTTTNLVNFGTVVLTNTASVGGVSLAIGPNSGSLVINPLSMNTNTLTLRSPASPNGLGILRIDDPSTNAVLYITTNGTLNLGATASITNAAGGWGISSNGVLTTQGGGGSVGAAIATASNALWTDIQNTNTIQAATNFALQSEINGNGNLTLQVSNALWNDIQNTNTIQVATNGALQTGISANTTLIVNVSNALWTDIQNTNTIQVATNGALQGEISGIETNFQFGSQILSNLADSEVLPIITGPTTNASDLWVTNGALYVTNVGTLTGVGIGGNSGNIVFSGTITGNGSGLTNSDGSAFADTSYLSSTNGLLLGDLSATNTALLGFLNATNGALLGDLNSTNGALLADLGATNGLLLGFLSATNTALLGDLNSTNGALLADLNSTNGLLIGFLSATNGALLADLNSTNGALLADLNSTNGLLIGFLQATNTALQDQLTSTNGSLLTDLGATNGLLLGFLSATNGALLGDLASTNTSLLADLNDTNTTLLGFLNATNTALVADITAATNAIVGAYFASGSEASNLVATGTLTNAILVGPTINGSDFWVTNGNVFVTNANDGAFQVLSVTNGHNNTGVAIDNAGNIAATANLTVNGTITGYGRGISNAYYLVAYNTSSQGNGGAGVAALITTTSSVGTFPGWSRPAADTLSPVLGGYYQVQYTAEAKFTAADVFEVFATNATSNVEIIGSEATLSFSSTTGTDFPIVAPVSASFIVQLNASDNLQFGYTCNNADVTLYPFGAAGAALAGAPSFSVSITRISP